MGVSLKDIAERADMSISAVSLVLGNRPNRISKEKQELIRKIAKELNYTPPRSGGLIPRQTGKAIGVILPDLKDLFYASIAMAITNICRTNDYNIMISSTDDSKEFDLSDIKVFRSREVDGLIFCPSSNITPTDYEEYSAALHALEKPVVFVDRYIPNIGFSAVTINQSRGAYYAVKHLLELGHRNIGVIGGSTQSFSERYCGIVAACAEYLLDMSQISFFPCDLTPVGAYDIAGTVLAKGCTAVFCYNDLMAYGLYKKYHELGIRIPKDISIIGFNDLYYSRCFEVPLTSVNVQGDRLGFSASERIFSELENPNQDKQVILLEPEISLRKSTKALSGQV